MTGPLRSGFTPTPTRLVVVGLVAVLGLTSCDLGGDAPATGPSWSGSASPTPGGVGGAEPAAFTGWSDPALVGKPYGDKVDGLLTFRGNPTRTYYGTGPMPRTTPARQWQFPRSGGLCGESTDEKGTRVWCGTGWTGQPAVFERAGRTWVVFGAYDHKIHFLDGETGERILPDFPTGDIIKGSVTIDPDGFPLVYSGSRDNYYRVIAIDRGRPTELWKLSARAVSPTMWNDDFDGAGLILDDYLFLGGENSQFHIVKLNRKYAANGKVTVKPKLVFNAPGWDAQLLRDVDDRMVSIENSVAISGNVVYFANSGGLVQGWDISGLKQGRKPKRVFRFWTGDDTDASIAVDETGALYVGSEYERGTARSKQVGQMMKLDPRRKGNPSVWHVDDHARKPAGIWGSPALHKDIAIFDTQGGEVLGVDRATGAVRWRFELPGPTWQSPVVVDDVLVIGDCNGTLHAYDVADTRAAPKPLWKVKLGGCIESTPAVWRGRIYVGTRAGAFHAISAR
ncbi:PQQ-binding-like beta-propeller repeat protein [Plantactinospora sp. KLBMP9567]|uniref:outer membrane protein assembly factor BamB family protein n=1 Tax=Plantactinospora sp. KLBMP9567 TaxID=3085900 RepID=UPI002982A1A4|nr:PQQ-binding-like beta-propeller repeat protein [Plantactinospora sp. KLBMP9567]MDW5326471.1 PQQ-binding-like beta-propeller repeat protein [Plantactinospora sp. KLBMP9567]